MCVCVYHKGVVNTGSSIVIVVLLKESSIKALLLIEERAKREL